MDKSKFAQLLNDLNEEGFSLACNKQMDYASEDALSNFKRMCALCWVLDIDVRRSPADNAAYLKLLKIDRRCNLRRKGMKPQNEPVKDSVIDEHIYSILEYACDIDEGLNENNGKS